jgi:hypothetical protein
MNVHFEHMTEMHRSLFCLLFGGIVGCGAAAVDEAPRCHNSNDCETGLQCQLAPVPESTSTLLPEPNGTRLQGASTAVAPSCGNYCMSPADCETGRTCEPVQAVGPYLYPCVQNECVLGCKHGDCPAGQLCEENACQPATPCTAPDFAGCPQEWTCDPGVETMEPPSWPGATSLPGYDSYWRAHAAGCRPLRCYERGASPCAEYLRCDTDTGACVGIPCTELGLCPQVDTTCRAPSTNEHADGFGCVLNNCNEGFRCRADELCDTEGAPLNSRGCRLQRCDEGFSCAFDQVCDVGHAQANEYGCRPQSCTEGYDCATGRHCAPEGNDPDGHGCVWLRCDEGGQCAPGERCNPTAVFADDRGCLSGYGECDLDADCSNQEFCVLSMCQDQLGECR